MAFPAAQPASGPSTKSPSNGTPSVSRGRVYPIRIAPDNRYHRWSPRWSPPEVKVAARRRHRGRSILFSHVASGYNYLTPLSGQTIRRGDGMIARVREEPED